MPVNHFLATIGNSAFVAAVVVYVIAMLLLLMSMSIRVSSPKPQATRVAVGAVSSSDADTPGVVLSEPKSARYVVNLASMGFNVTLVGLACHLVSLIARGVATHRVPWGNMFEFINLACLAAIILALYTLRSPQLRNLIGFALIPVIILLFVAGTYLYASAAPVVPALKSYWLVIHVSIVSIGSGVFMIAGVFSALYIAKTTLTGKWSAVDRFLGALPPLDTLDRYAYRTTILAFPLFTIGVICGAIWAESAWGRFWGWDPKETASFIAWVIYAAYLHARATAGWSKTGAAWINIAGFTAMIVNLFVINLLTTGLHEYAGVN